MPKMGKKLVAMCSVAVGLIYSGAYAVTAEQANAPITDGYPAAGSSGQVVGVAPGESQTPNHHGRTTAVGSANANTQTKPTPAGYKDGTYKGVGFDRRGSLEVTVTIKQGKISDVQVTAYDMRYSETYIDPVLVQEVMQRQNDNIDIVSGATASSENFQTAVQQALDQAKQA